MSYEPREILRHILAEATRTTVAGDHGERMLQEGLQIILVHAVEDGAGTALGFEIEDELDLIVERV